MLLLSNDIIGNHFVSFVLVANTKFPTKTFLIKEHNNYWKENTNRGQKVSVREIKGFNNPKYKPKL